ncbi:OmpA family protein [Chitinophaga sp. GbtcB8]|uniref:OmpA family protein n=1 Tax=Chitinophaga sp. GbtcB8 TaxID=2824753 RepID=UPI001C30823E|nr:OmpA family protein [Chitinophaga sp. GbtcB8]
MDKRKFNFPTLFNIIAAAGLAIAVTGTAHGQYVKKRAEDQAELYNYARAIPLYEKAYKKRVTAEAARGAAEGYRYINEYVFAESWYEKLMQISGHTATDELHYAEVLMNNSKYAEAKTVLDSFLQKGDGNGIAGNMRKGCDSAIKWLAAPVKGRLENVQALNSSWSDWSTAFIDGRIIFASDRPTDSLHRKTLTGTSHISKRYYGWTGKSYLHLYEGNGKDTSSTRLMGRDINGYYHSASASYTVNEKRFYYAVTELLRKRGSFLGKDEPYTLNVEIIEQRWDTVKQVWKQTALFPYNGIFNYSVGDPCITPDGKTLYFAADYGDKGYGGTDIYYSQMDEAGKWQTPVNMGPGINTSGNERTPALDGNGIFYFASDGRPGMGGLDLYRAGRTGENDAWQVVNMGSPVNSAQDDFAPAFDNTVFYFSSNRFGGQGSDDIYRFNAARIALFRLSGKVLDKHTNTPLAGVVVTLDNNQTGAPQKVITDSAGEYQFTLDTASSYKLSVVKTGFSAETAINVTTTGLSVNSLRHDIYMEQVVLNKPVVLQAIYFDLDKSDIRTDAVAELERLIKLLKDNPTWKMEISSHTDARGSSSYNMKLSQRRAASVVNYLVSKGIDKERLTAKGYGESKLVNRCADNVPCSEAEHQANRRTAFTVLDK